jgi:hypothetical protein
MHKKFLEYQFPSAPTIFAKRKRAYGVYFKPLYRVHFKFILKVGVEEPIFFALFAKFLIYYRGQK